MSRGIYYKGADGIWHSVVMPYIRTDIPIPTTLALTLTVQGAGGGVGGNDSHGGYSGSAGHQLTGTLTIPFGKNIQVYVGGAGGAGSSGTGNDGGAGGSNTLGYNGGHGGYTGNQGWSGSGGGGGAATVISIDGTVTVVAAGGGGGGGGGNNSTGQPSQGYESSGAIAGGRGGDKTSGGEHGGGCKIICTKLHELGYLSDNIYEADERFGQYLRDTDPYAYYGYVRWASVVVDWMDKDGPQCMFWIRDKDKRNQAQRNMAISWARRIATPWAEHMAYIMGVGETDNRAGKLIMKTGMWVSRMIGKYTKTTEPTKSVALGYIMWATFGVFWLLAGVK